MRPGAQDPAGSSGGESLVELMPSQSQSQRKSKSKKKAKGKQNSPKAPKTRGPNVKLSSEEKRAVLDFLKHNPKIWSKGAVDHLDTVSVEDLWRDISSQIGRSPKEVKCWYQSRRAKLSKLRRTKSGQAHVPLSATDAEFVTEWSFLIPALGPPRDTQTMGCTMGPEEVSDSQSDTPQVEEPRPSTSTSTPLVQPGPSGPSTSQSLQDIQRDIPPVTRMAEKALGVISQQLARKPNIYDLAGEKMGVLLNDFHKRVSEDRALHWLERLEELMLKAQKDFRCRVEPFSGMAPSTQPGPSQPSASATSSFVMEADRTINEDDPWLEWNPPASLIAEHREKSPSPLDKYCD